ncbi:MAG: low affinity iron permease family protein [Roseococcus sp.]|nr:low affinity iron permease family protein [Roseococcus sp.]
MEPRTLIASLAQRSAKYISHPWVVAAAIVAVLVGLVVGFLLSFAENWHNLIGTTTALITFVMVFFIQNAQDRDTLAIQLKLDELIRATEGAQNRLMALESQSDETLDEVKEELSDACEDGTERATAASPSE